MDYLWLYHSPVRLLHSQLVLRTYLLKKYNSLEKKEEVMRTNVGVIKMTIRRAPDDLRDSFTIIGGRV